MSITKQDPKDSPIVWYSVRLGFLLHTRNHSGESDGSKEEIILKFQEEFFNEIGLLDHVCTGL